MKGLITLLLVLSAPFLHGQSKFNWAVAAQSLDYSYVSVYAHPQGGVVALASRDAQSEIKYESNFIQGDGTPYRDGDMHENISGDVIFRMDATGKILWDKTIRRGYGHVNSLHVAPDGSILFCAYVVDVSDEYYDDESGYDEEEEEDEGIEGEEEEDEAVGYGYLLDPDKMVKAGSYIVVLDESGTVKKLVPVQKLSEDSDLEIQSLRAYGKNQYLLGGFIDEGKLAENLEVKTYKGGGDFILLLDSIGVPVWGDVVAYRKESCCTQTVEGSMLDVAPDGTMYMGGTYFGGGIFSNGKQTISPQNYNAKSGGDSPEAYLVAYHPDGKIKWISTDGSLSRFTCLKASNEGVFVSHSVRGPIAFGLKADTSNFSNSVISFIDRNGKTGWNHLSAVERYSDLTLDNKGQLLAVGNLNYRVKVKELGAFKMGEKDDQFIVSFNKKGTITNLWSADLMPSSQPALLTVDANHNVYLALEVWCSLPLDLDILDDNFPKIKCYGGTAIIGKIMF